MECIFEYKKVPDRVKVKLVIIKLKDRACAWWEQLRHFRGWQGKSTITDWEKMKIKMKGHFLSFGYTQTLFQLLHSLRQGMRSVDDYTKMFYQLVARNYLSETESNDGMVFGRIKAALIRFLQPSLDVDRILSIPACTSHGKVAEQKASGQGRK